ncbi:tetratricopeptide repeat protein [Pseudooceanicola nanhaiensis]|uniref:tetratricopeptide repeat protein n=1 Tax=Pseudooceanicola nanhaiensis TaxID=375761 RepID=UPI001CD33C62|nr:tetratricopeptide repeat protein [Pseudooceanicola nanhaiensis]MCA0919480.1 tetratricopeptide repeat protein [Pseudooceanicola nanhaiensis]
MRPPLWRAFPLLLLGLTAFLPGCGEQGLARSDNGPFAPGLSARGEAVDGLIVGNRLLEAGENELALEAFTRAAGEQGMTDEVLAGLGAANLGLGRLGQAEQQLRRVTQHGEAPPQVWNNLGVVLISKGAIPEAALVLRRAYALDNGESDAIRDNLRLALALQEENSYSPEQNDTNYNVVRTGSSEFLISRATP